MSRTTIQLEGSDDDRLELPGQPYALALWNLIIRPPRRRYDLSRLGPTEFRLWTVWVKRVDINLTNQRGMTLRCSHFLPRWMADAHPGDPVIKPMPCVIYLHQNASCRLEALSLVPLFLPLGITLFALDFAGCGESDGEYISLGWYERDDLAECVEYLRRTGKVSAIGLWGRSMGAVTALLHADRDHSIGGMVLDSPFCNLHTLATELAQSEYLAVKVPSWLLSGALAVGRMRIKSLCDFDIDQLTPENHVGNSFIPALFIHGRQDDFIGPHHTQKLFEAYNGDKELEMVEGDHNSPRPSHLNRKAVSFFCRAFRCSPDATKDPDNLALLLGLQTDFCFGGPPLASRQLIVEAARHMVALGSRPPAPTGARAPPALTEQRPSMGDRHQAFLPFRATDALQLCRPDAEGGICICTMPMGSEWGGTFRPPEVLLAHVSASGLHVTRVTEHGREVLAHTAAPVEVEAPMMLVLEVRQSPSRLRLMFGDGGPELQYQLGEECDAEVFLWPWDACEGSVEQLEFGITDLTPPDDVYDQAPVELASGGSAAAAESSVPAQAGERRPSSDSSSGYCPTQ